MLKRPSIRKIAFMLILFGIACSITSFKFNTASDSTYPKQKSSPLRTIIIDPICLTPAVKALAQSIYDDRRFADLPNLADALEELGCTNHEIARHCRQQGEHVRGCWAVDLLLCKQ